jgi:selenocysteine lyase/cysteine desulfurase
MFDVDAIRAQFPILSREVNGKPLVYLDNGASAQKPRAVIDAMTHMYEHEYANVHRGLHYLSNVATDHYEGVRGKIARFLNAKSEDDIILNSGVLWLGRAAFAGGRRDRVKHFGTPCEYRALALSARTAGGCAEVGGLRR